MESCTRQISGGVSKSLPLKRNCTRDLLAQNGRGSMGGHHLRRIRRSPWLVGGEGEVVKCSQVYDQMCRRVRFTKRAAYNLARR